MVKPLAGLCLVCSSSLVFASGRDAVASLSSISLSVSSSGFLRLKSAILFVLNYIWSKCDISSDGDVFSVRLRVLSRRGVVAGKVRRMNEHGKHKACTKKKK